MTGKDGSVTFRAAGTITTVATVVSALLVAGCGGGGGGSGGGSGSGDDLVITPPPPPPPPQNLGIAPTPSEPVNVPTTTLTVRELFDTWTATYSSVPGDMATFNGHYANTSVNTLTVSKNGLLVLGPVSNTQYYLSNPYSPLGVVSTTNGVTNTLVVTSFTPFTPEVRVGRSGPVSTYSTTPITSQSYVYTQTYDVTFNSPTALFLNIYGVLGPTGGMDITYAVTASGAATLARLRLYVLGQGQTVTFYAPGYCC